MKLVKEACERDDGCHRWEHSEHTPRGEIRFVANEHVALRKVFVYGFDLRDGRSIEAGYFPVGIVDSLGTGIVGSIGDAEKACEAKLAELLAVPAPQEEQLEASRPAEAAL